MFNQLFSAGFGDTLIRFAICFIANWVIVNFLYYKKSHRRDFFFVALLVVR